MKIILEMTAAANISKGCHCAFGSSLTPSLLPGSVSPPFLGPFRCLNLRLAAGPMTPDFPLIQKIPFLYLSSKKQLHSPSAPLLLDLTN